MHHNLSHCKRGFLVESPFRCTPSDAKAPKRTSQLGQRTGKAGSSTKTQFVAILTSSTESIQYNLKQFDNQNISSRHYIYIVSNTFKYECHLTTPATALNILAPAVVKQRWHRPTPTEAASISSVGAMEMVLQPDIICLNASWEGLMGTRNHTTSPRIHG